MSNLAIHGGAKTVRDGMILAWPPVDESDFAAVRKSIEDRVLTTGGESGRAFPIEFAAWNGNKHAVYTNSGTASLHMCIAACGVGAGDHVLVTAYSWSSSATCILHHNGIPVFVDIDFDTMCIDPAKIEAAITPRTKAIVVVHLHGFPVDMDAVNAIAKKHGLKVIEDCCQAHGAQFKGRKVGTLGDCAAFSFNQNKCLCTGEGGMFVTDDEALLKQATMLWSFGETRTPSEDRDYHAYALGWMYRGTDMVAAFGRTQLAKMDGYFENTRRGGAIMNERLVNIDGLILPTEPEGHIHNWYNYTVRIDMEAIGWTGDPRRMRDAVMKAIQAEGAPVSVWQNFILPAMTVFRAKNAYGKGCPWTFDNAGDGVEYDPDRFPVAQRHCETHFGMTMPLRAPNGADVAEAVAEAYAKVFTNIAQIDPDKVLG